METMGKDAHATTEKTPESHFFPAIPRQTKFLLSTQPSFVLADTLFYKLSPWLYFSFVAGLKTGSKQTWEFSKMSNVTKRKNTQHMRMPFRFERARAEHLRVGGRGETLACSLLQAKGYDILLRNFRSPRGEVDIVARDGIVLCFIEVKTRKVTSIQRPAAGLRLRQKRRIYRAALSYLREIDNPAIAYRFDLIEMVLNGRRPVEIRHWLNHFGKRSIYKFSFRNPL